MEPDPSQQEGIFIYAYSLSNPVDGFCPADQKAGAATAAEIAYSIGSQATIAVSTLPANSGSQSYVSNGNTWVYTTNPQSYTSASPSVVPQAGSYYAINPKTGTIASTGVSVLNTAGGGLQINVKSAVNQTLAADGGPSYQFVGASVNGKAPEHFGTPSMSMDNGTVGNSLVHCVQNSGGVACAEDTWSGPIGRGSSTPGPMYAIDQQGYAAPVILPQRQVDEEFANSGLNDPYRPAYFPHWTCGAKDTILFGLFVASLSSGWVDIIRAGGMTTWGAISQVTGGPGDVVTGSSCIG